jgi:hypothetical protein
MEVRMKQVCVIEFMRKDLQALAFTECLCRPDSGCEHDEAVVGVFQQWQQWYERQVMFWAALHSCQLTK